MKVLQTTIFVALLLALLGTFGCDQRSDTTESGETNALELETTTNGGMANQPPADAAQDEPVDEATLESTRSLIENAAANRDLTTFSALLQSSNTDSNLRGTGPYTLFAPSESAFKALPNGLLDDLQKPENQERLQQILNNHVIAGKLTVDDLQDGAILKTAAGHQLKVSKRKGQVRINGAVIEDTDVMSRNGILHVVNKLLIPAEGDE